MKTPEQTITNHTRITIGMAITAFVLFSAGIGEWDSTRLQISELQKSQWTVTDQLQWTEEFQKQNPNIDVPIPQVEPTAQTRTPSVLALARTNILH
jgi:hypothetical protein